VVQVTGVGEGNFRVKQQCIHPLRVVLTLIQSLMGVASSSVVLLAAALERRKGGMVGWKNCWRKWAGAQVTDPQQSSCPYHL